MCFKLNTLYCCSQITVLNFYQATEMKKLSASYYYYYFTEKDLIDIFYNIHSYKLFYDGINEKYSSYALYLKHNFMNFIIFLYMMFITTETGDTTKDTFMYQVAEEKTDQFEENKTLGYVSFPITTDNFKALIYKVIL